jgi:hypothetical protein
MPPSGSSTGPSMSDGARVRVMARLYRIVRGMHRKPCPADSDGRCYWCGAQVYLSGLGPEDSSTGNIPGLHAKDCPWSEYVALLPTLEALDGESVHDADQADPLGGGR